MLLQLKRLPDSTQQILRLVACVGAEFNLDTLSIVCDSSPQTVFLDLHAAIQAGLIQPLSELDEDLLIQNYKFSHDRVQQTAYISCITETSGSSSNWSQFTRKNTARATIGAVV